MQPTSVHTQTLHKHTLHIRAQIKYTPHQALGLKHAPRSHTQHPATHGTHTQTYRTRARAHTRTCMHTYTHSPPPPSLQAEEKGARRRGGEGKRGDGPKRRCRHRRSFPFDLRCCPLNVPVPRSQAKRVSWVRVGSSRNPRKTGRSGEIRRRVASARARRGPCFGV